MLRGAPTGEKAVSPHGERGTPPLGRPWHPYSLGGAYVNFMMEEGQERVQATYRDNYDRLVQIKNKYDPGNLFRVNQNIRPTG